MICLIALVVFGVLGLFSLKYRTIAKEAFDCVFRRMTLRKCESGLDKRLKSQITGKLMARSPSIGRFIYRRFEMISWIFTILLVASLAQSGVSVYNYAVYSNCNGPTNEGFCIFDPLAEAEISACGEEGAMPVKALSAPKDVSRFNAFGNRDSKVRFVMFGCYTCPYTKSSADTVFDIYERYKDRVEFIFIDFPIARHEGSALAAEAAQCVFEQEPEMLIEYSKRLYSDETIDLGELRRHARESGADEAMFEECLSSHRYRSFVDESMALGHGSGVYGTPTFFINDIHIVGPTTKKAFSKLIEDELRR